MLGCYYNDGGKEMEEIPVKFKVFVQDDPKQKQGWHEFTRNGFVPALPSKGIKIFLKQDNVTFRVDEVYMIESIEGFGEIWLIQIIPNSSKEILEDLEEISYRYPNGWKLGHLADNTRREFIG
jgi:hypothetical protein